MKAIHEYLELRLQEVEATINTIQDTADTDELSPWELVRDQLIVELNAEELN